MGTMNLLKFEIKKQVSSLTYMIILGICMVFAISQLNEVFHLPVTTDEDIYALEKSGELNYIFKPTTDKEIKEKTIKFLQEQINNASIPANRVEQLNVVLTMLQEETNTLDDVIAVYKEDEFVYPWLCVSKEQFSKRYGSVEEVNHNLQRDVGEEGYSTKLIIKYVSYMQAISAFLVFPIFLFAMLRDYQHNMFETVYVQPMSTNKYILCRYFGALLPLIVYLYILGEGLNLISISRFIGAGYKVDYTSFITYFMIYLLPTIFFFSGLVTALMLVVRKVVAVFPIYVLYVIFNITPEAFRFGTALKMINPIIRLDRQIPSVQYILINRLAYIMLGIILLMVGCKAYKNLRHDLRKGITL